MTFTKGSGLDAKQYSVTVGNPKDGLKAADVSTIATDLENTYKDTFTMKSAKYVETSETYVYPLS